MKLIYKFSGRQLKWTKNFRTGQGELTIRSNALHAEGEKAILWTRYAETIDAKLSKKLW